MDSLPPAESHPSMGSSAGNPGWEKEKTHTKIKIAMMATVMSSWTEMME